MKKKKETQTFDAVQKKKKNTRGICYFCFALAQKEAREI